MAGFQEDAFQQNAFGGSTPTKTILGMVQAAEAELGLSQSSSVEGTTDKTATQMLALANRTVDELRRMHPTGWSQLQWEYNIAVAVPTVQAGNMLAGSQIITGLSSTAAISAHSFQVSGTGIPQAARIVSVDSSTQVTLSMYNTNTDDLTASDFTFMQDTYSIPIGFDWFQNRTMWDRTNRWELLGPDSPQLDQWHRSGIYTTGPRRHFRRIGPYSASFRLWPPPAELTTPLQLVFEYISAYSVIQEGTSTTFQMYFTADGDKCLLDENAIIQGIKWMFWEAKGFGSYVTLQNRWVDYVNRLIARDQAAPTLGLVKTGDPLLISSRNVQDGFFPGSSSD